MTKGRKPVPTALRILRGNPSGRPLPEPGSEPTPKNEAPEMPDFIKEDEIAVEEWDRITKELDTIGLLNKLDHALIESWVICYSRWINAEKKVLEKGTLSITGQKITTKTKKDGTIEEVKSGGNVITSPYLWVANKSWQQLLKLASEMGMTPSARSRISITPKKKEDKWGDI
jgi:P27 family predicted phage terminase small subunit